MATTESTRPSFWVQPTGTQQSALSNQPVQAISTQHSAFSQSKTNPKTSAPPRLSGEIGGRP